MKLRRALTGLATVALLVGGVAFTAPANAALGVDAKITNYGSVSFGVGCNVITPTYNVWLVPGNGASGCNSYYVPPYKRMNLLRYHDGQWFYSAVNVGRGSHNLTYDGGTYAGIMRNVSYP